MDRLATLCEGRHWVICCLTSSGAEPHLGFLCSCVSCIKTGWQKQK